MARYAMSQGIAVPADVVGGLTAIRAQLSPADPAQGAPALSGTAANQASFVPPPVVVSGNNEELANRLAEIHQQLARIVVPATPRTLLLLAQHRGKTGLSGLLGPVPLVRQMMFIALVFLVALLSLSTVEEISPGNIARGFFENSGTAQLFCQSFLLCAAGLGACFSALFEVNRYVGRGVYDPKYDSSYWSRLVLGLMAGVMLAELLGPQFIGSPADAAAAAAPTASPDAVAATAAFAKPTLAMLGGFSASLVYRILERLVQSIESLVAGAGESGANAKGEALRARLDAEATTEKMRIAGRLAAMQPHLRGEPEVSLNVARLIQELLGQTRATQAEPITSGAQLTAASHAAAVGFVAEVEVEPDSPSQAIPTPELAHTERASRTTDLRPKSRATHPAPTQPHTTESQSPQPRAEPTPALRSRDG